MSAPTIPTDAHATPDCQPVNGVGGPNSVGTHVVRDSQTDSGVDGLNSTDAQSRAVSHDVIGVGGPNPCDAQSDGDDHTRPGVAGLYSHDAQLGTAGQSGSGVVGSAPTESTVRPSATDAAARSAPAPPGTPSVGPIATGSVACPEGSSPPTAPMTASIAIGRTVSLADPFLALSAEVLNDLEEVRKANVARLRELTRDDVDADGERRGWGLDERHRDVARLAALVGELEKSEHQAVLNLNRLVRAHPLGPWIKNTRGVGEKQAARLLASIGDPAWNNATSTWRTCRQLYTYCGYGDAEKQVRRRGERGNWDPAAKMRAHLVIASAVKVLRAPCARPEEQAWADHVEGCKCSPYRLVYDDGRQKYANAVHVAECKRCGPAGKPAQPGSTLSAGHQEARGYRLACKALLKDLWREARRLHGFDDEDVAA